MREHNCHWGVGGTACCLSTQGQGRKSVSGAPETFCSRTGCASQNVVLATMREKPEGSITKCVASES